MTTAMHTGNDTHLLALAAVLEARHDAPVARGPAFGPQVHRRTVLLHVCERAVEDADVAPALQVQQLHDAAIDDRRASQHLRAHDSTAASRFDGVDDDGNESKDEDSDNDSMGRRGKCGHGRRRTVTMTAWTGVTTADRGGQGREREAESEDK